MSTIRAKSFRRVPDAGWGFQPLEALSHSLDGQGRRLGILSEADLEAKVSRIRHPKKKEQPKPYR